MRVRSLLLPVCLAASLVLALPAQAEKLETEYYTVDLPDTWQQLQYSNTTINGRSGGASLKTITQCFAQQYQSRSGAQVKGKYGTFSFKDVNGDDGMAYVTVQDQVYMVVTISGNQRKGRSLIKEFSSETFAELIPAL